MAEKHDADLIAPCGINCGVCRYYLARVKGMYKSTKSGCIGCIPRNSGCTCQGGCEPLRTKSVRFCFECSDFPCDKLKKLNHRYTTKYHTNLIDNLLYIQKNGINKWITEDKKRWECDECGGTVSIHGHICFDCGEKQSN